MTFEIKDAKDLPNKPLPRERGGGPSIYPFREMKVGDVFLVPADHHGAGCSSKMSSSRVAVAASWFGKRHNMKFKTRRQECGGMRVERIK